MKEFVQSGFGGLAYLMAVIYYAVRLLPAGHPYINPANIGRFGIRHVIAQAANNLVLKKENIDQILIFAALLTGFILLVLQFVFLIGIFLFAPAFASPPSPDSFGGLFKTETPTLDIAFMLLDSVFGVPEFFNSCVAQGVACGENAPQGIGIRPAGSETTSPFHNGLHDLFQFYNTAILVVAVLIFLYYILIMVAETAQSGTPFGRRFNHIWAPLRLVVALGLLVPLNYGLNSAQYITLFAARMGSGFATNGWHLFNRALENSLDGSGMTMVARPTTPEVDHIWQFIAITKTCQLAYETLGKLEDYDIKEIRPYLVKVGEDPLPMAGTPWESALNFYNNGDILIRFGNYNREKNSAKSGYVRSWCGDLVISTRDLKFQGTKNLQAAYYDWIRMMWEDENVYGLYGYARRASCVGIGPTQFDNCNDSLPAPKDKFPNEAWKAERSAQEFSKVKLDIDNAWEEVKKEIQNQRLSQDILDRGWGGAGMWYNEIARWNGAFFSAAKTLPTVSKMPEIMQKIEDARRGHDQNTNAAERYETYLGGGSEIKYSFTGEADIAAGLSKVYIDLRKNASARPETQTSGNIIYDTLNRIFGIDGLLNLRKNEEYNVHPMAALTAAGKSIIDAAIFNLMGSLALGAFGGFVEAMDPHIGGGINMASRALMTFATIGLTVGFSLYYVLPFLPFIYFFFAVGTWVKSIFEAMVGAPLWALAHLRVDGNGLPGEAAMNGYYMIFEIFIRPILTVFGLIASVLIFSALVTTLNGIFDLVTSNMTGFDCETITSTGCDGDVDMFVFTFKRAVIDEFFFTVIYAILVYLIGTSCFKLIDQIPANILRWLGAGVRTFDSHDGDATQGLLQYTGAGSAMLTQQVVPTMQEGAHVVGRGAGTAVETMADLVTRNTSFTTTGAPGGGGTTGGGSTP